jgi:hypothetical protein
VPQKSQGEDNQHTCQWRTYNIDGCIIPWSDGTITYHLRSVSSTVIFRFAETGLFESSPSQVHAGLVEQSSRSNCHNANGCKVEQTKRFQGEGERKVTDEYTQHDCHILSNT